MFVQIVEGWVSDRRGLRSALERWETDFAAAADGWLGSTGGVTSDGLAVVVSRFTSRAAARRVSDRPDHNEWWTTTSRLFRGVPILRNSDDVVEVTPGDPAAAGFVQVVHGAVSNPAAFRDIAASASAAWLAHRPDLLGSVGVLHEGAEYSMVLYFTSESEARRGERTEPGAELLAQLRDLHRIEVGAPTFRDLKEPWFFAPALLVSAGGRSHSART